VILLGSAVVSSRKQAARLREKPEAGTFDFAPCHLWVEIPYAQIRNG
jgi:hypothetical protein